MSRFWVSHDYGQGALWWAIKADNAEQISSLSDKLDVFGDAPAWMDEATKQDLIDDEQDVTAVRDNSLLQVINGQT